MLGLVAYEIDLPPQLRFLHNIFHMSQRREYISDSSNVLEMKDVQLKEILIF